jgi:hypothetical protein
VYYYSGVEAFPAIDDLFEPLRSVYTLAYDSRVITSGAQTVIVEAEIDGAMIASAPRLFELTILPPNPVWISPPLEIERRAGQPASPESADLQPRRQVLQVLIEFPDGLERSLTRTRLLVNGQVAAENTQPPFDQFTWDLAQITREGVQLLQVEAQDTLGLLGRSIETPVQIRVVIPPPNPLNALIDRLPLVALIAALLAGTILLWVLVVGGRLRPQSLLSRGKARRRSATDPVTQPVPVQPLPAARPRPLQAWTDHLAWPARRAAPRPFAYLERLSLDGLPENTRPIQVLNRDLTIGSDPAQAALVLEDPSVEAAHARLARQRDGSFRVQDLGSTAGTWLNYAPVSREGARLEHGDHVHFGRVGFRFSFPDARRARQIVITPQEKD